MNIPSEGNGKPLKVHSPMTITYKQHTNNRTKNIMKHLRNLNIATWNVRSLYESGKLDNTINEFNRLKLDFLGISETWWQSSGCIKKGVHFYYSGNDSSRHRKGVGIMIAKKHCGKVSEFIPHSDRIAILKLKTKPVDLNIIQVYAPNADCADDEIESFYNDLKKMLMLTKKHDINIIMGDFNAKVGKEETPNVTGKFGLGNRNERGNRLVQFCQEEEFIIGNTYYKLPERRLYTWKSPQDGMCNIKRNQIDYILINKRFKSSMIRAKTLPGADVPSDHNLLLATIRTRLTSRKTKQKKSHIDIQKLENDDIRNDFQNKLNELLTCCNTGENPIECWNNTADKIRILTTNTLGTKINIAKEKWMNDEILNLINERRKYRNINIDEYKRRNKEIRDKIRDARNHWMERQCEDIERLEKLHDSFNLHRKLKEICNLRRYNAINTLYDTNGKVITDENEKHNIWVQYVHELFKDDSRDENTSINDSTDDPLLKITMSEIKNAIKLSKPKKATGCDEISADILKLIDDSGMPTLMKVFNYIYETAKYPSSWLKSTFIVIPKKSNAKQCKDYRLISLMSHTLKIFLKIIHNRIHQKCEAAMGTTQFGFKKGLGTREAIFSLQMLTQKSQDANQDICMCFIDYEKAFDKIQHNKLIKIMKDLDINRYDIKCIQNLYWNQTAEIRFGDSTTKETKIYRGVRQGCILSPLLFNVYAEKIFEEAINDTELGIKVNGIYINNIRYADDTTLVTNNFQDLQTIINKVEKHSKDFGLNINIDKTKFIIVNKSSRDYSYARLSIGGKTIERVKNFKYLGVWLNDQWDHDHEIRGRIEMARAAFMKIKKILTRRDIPIKLKTRFLKCYVWSTLLYGCEAWTLKTVSIHRLEAFEMWCYRKMMRISWTDKISNDIVLNRMQISRNMLTDIKRRKVAYFGHITRGDKYDLLKLLIQGKIEGQRGIGRKKMTWLDNIKEWTGLKTIGELTEAARNRHKFNDIVDNMT